MNLNAGHTFPSKFGAYKTKCNGVHVQFITHFLTWTISAIRSSFFSIVLAQELQDDLADLAYSVLKLKLGAAIADENF